MDFVIDLEKIERGEVSDRAIRNIIRYGLAKILAEKDKDDVSTQCKKLLEFVSELKENPITVNTADVNQQHYEVPAEFFQLVLGKRLKYSSCYWPESVSSLDEAEESMLQLICDRAQIADGQEILDLGCGWGSLSLYLAEKYPNSKITALSNFNTQKEFIDSRKQLQNLGNIDIITGDISDFDTADTFDRIFSIEMFEHIRNYEKLLAKISACMKPEGLLFVHIFTHLKYAYYFENNWTADYFFTGGIMPSDNLLLYFPNHVCIKNHWRVSGEHYQKTSEAWLENQDRNKEKAIEIFRKIYSPEKATKYFIMWRLFFLTVAESFGYKYGQEWIISHYLFSKR